eukprot:bmy_21161T0
MGRSQDAQKCRRWSEKRRDTGARPASLPLPAESCRAIATPLRWALRSGRAGVGFAKSGSKGPEAGVLVSGALAAASLPPPSLLSPPGGDRSSPRVPSGASEAGRTPRGLQPGPGASPRGLFILRKKPEQITFLHVYHHGTVLLNCFYHQTYLRGKREKLA